MARKAPQLAKLTRPRLHKAVARERLFALLDEARAQKPAICVVGPPGAGKTTLVASWLDARGIKGIWYQVDSGDADLATFFYYLREAAKPFTRKGQRPLPLLTPEYLHDIEGFSRRFFRELFARLPEDATLVLDNYQDVSGDNGLHAVVSEAVHQVPHGIAVIAVSRADPPEVYARLIANEHVQLVNWEALKLTLDEARAIAVAKGTINAGVLESFYEYTAGWAAGLVLALERFKQGGMPAEAEWATQQATFGYFANEIFDRLPDMTRSFLMCTALLPQVQVHIAEAVTGNSEAELILEDLYRRHFFTHRRPGQPATYLYHALFQIFLQARAADAFTSDEISRLRRHSARLLEETREADSAVRLYLDAGEWNEAERVIVEHASVLLAQGRWKTLDEWLAALPAEKREQSAWLVYWQGMSRLAFEPETARGLLESAYDQFTKSGDFMGRLLAASAASEAIYLEAAEFIKLDRWLVVLEELLAQEPKFPSAAAELQVYSGLLAAITFRAPAHPLALRCIERVLALMIEPIDANQRMTGATAMMLYCCYMGRLADADELARRVEPLLKARELTPLNEAVWYAYLGYLSVVDHSIERGLRNMGKAVEIAEKNGFTYVLVVAYSLHSSLLYATDSDAADRWLAKAEPYVNSSRPYDAAHFLGNQLFRAADKGEWAAAVEYGRKTFDYLEGTGTLFQRLIMRLPLAWAQAELGLFEEARASLEECNQLISLTGASCYLALSQLTGANLYRVQGDHEQYVALLRKGFGTAARNYAAGRLACWIPPAAAPGICEDALQHGIEPQFVREFIAGFPLSAPSHASEYWPWPVKVYTLGRTQILVDDKPLEFGHKAPRKPLALLKVLIAQGGRDVPQWKLLDALWPEEEGDAAERALEVALHRLRKLLARQDAVHMGDRCISLDEKVVWTDARAMDELTTVVLSAETPNEDWLQSEAEHVLSLYRGPFLHSEPEADWALTQRERLRSRFVLLVTEVGRRLEGVARWDDAIRWYLKGLETDDLTESFYQGLMRCYLAKEQRGEGLSAFRRMRQTLSVTLGTNPSPASLVLFEALQSH